ncbi:MAG: hypothetical protein QJT81_08440 [Candidatus Thiothrix putei]|uniref:Uncharacterized protein n=1 Tax=Candidatus Thiothrix putei TaxID=3080811 RepID=A0AA95HKP1_9GAMM|nr:MAG: hypothetical protein QJT81_08440 [Candidatus Thiothrix putei]
MANVTPWIEHLSNPLVLVGFAVFTLAGLVKLFKPEKLSGKETAGLFHKGLNFVFVLGLLVVILGFTNSFMEKWQTVEAAKPIPTPPIIKQSISNSSGLNGQAGRDLNLNQGGGTLSQQTNLNPSTMPESPVPNVEQQIDGSSGVNGQGGRDTNIQTLGK